MAGLGDPFHLWIGDRQDSRRNIPKLTCHFLLPLRHIAHVIGLPQGSYIFFSAAVHIFRNQ
jgi:thymidylate synthase